MNHSQEKTEGKQAVVLALGMFDGVHLGHQALLKRAVEMAKKCGAQPMAYSFVEHPQQVFGGEVECLTRAQERADIIESFGVQACLVPFDRALAALSPEAFIERLIERFDLRGVVVGFNYHFGVCASGDEHTLRALGEKEGFAVDVVGEVQWGGQSVSSSRIRQALKDGRLDEANAMLGRPYFFRGIVGRGRQIGTQIGFPTLNLSVEGKAVPAFGVYSGQVRRGHDLFGNEGFWPAVVNIGDNPTVKDDARVIVESHVFAPIGTLYDEEIVVRLLRFQRGQERFGSLEALQEQIAKDSAEAAIFLGEE